MHVLPDLTQILPLIRLELSLSKSRCLILTAARVAISWKGEVLQFWECVIFSGLVSVIFCLSSLIYLLVDQYLSPGLRALGGDILIKPSGSTRKKKVIPLLHNMVKEHSRPSIQ